MRNARELRQFHAKIRQEPRTSCHPPRNENRLPYLFLRSINEIKNGVAK